MSTAVADPTVTPSPAAPADQTSAPPSSSPSSSPEPSDDITITSTTDTEAEVQAAIEGKGVAAPPPAAPAKDTPKPDAKTDAKTDTPKPDGTPGTGPDAAAASEAARTLAGRKKSALDEMRDRVDRVTFEREETRRQAEAHAAEAARLRAENDALKAGKGTTATPDAKSATPTAPPKPTLKQFQDDPTVDDPYAALAEALAEWTADRKVEAIEAKLRGELKTRDDAATVQQQEAVVQAQRTREWDAHTSRTAAFAAATPDYDTISQAAIQAIVDSEEGGFEIPAPIMSHVVLTETGPALFFHLVQDPVAFRRIASAKDIGTMLTQLGKYEAKLEAAGKLTMPKPGAPATPAVPSRTADASTSPSAPAVPVSSAPAPPSLVGSSPTASTGSLEEMDFASYSKMRNEQERKRNRR